MLAEAMLASWSIARAAPNRAVPMERPEGVSADLGRLPVPVPMLLELRAAMGACLYLHRRSDLCFRCHEENMPCSNELEALVEADHYLRFKQGSVLVG